MTGSETSPLILSRDEGQGYAEGLKAGGAAQLEAQDREGMEGTGQPRTSRGSLWAHRVTESVRGQP